MKDNYHPNNKQELLSVINEKRNSLDFLIESLSVDQKLTPGVEAYWSIKDLMAHIAAWEHFAYDRIHSALTGESLKYPVIESDHFIDDFNSSIYEANKDIPYDLIEADYHSAHKELMREIENLDDNLIQAKLPFTWAGELTFLDFISANTHWHYIDHMASIRKFFEER